MKKAAFLFILWLMAGTCIKTNAQELQNDTISVAATLPRFLYEGDRMEVHAEISNNSNKERTGQVTLQLADASTNTSVDGWFQNVFPVQFFTVAAHTTESVSFPIEVPYLFKKPLYWRISAQSETTVDSKEGTLPVFTTKTLVTEKLVVPILPGTRKYTFSKLVQTDAATEQHALSFVYFPNLVWHVVQTLPYFENGQAPSALQAWNQFYAFALAAKISNTAPEIIQTMDSWKKEMTKPDSPATNIRNSTMNNAQPYNKGATYVKTDATEKKDLILFLDSSNMQSNLQRSFDSLRKLQKTTGGFSWFANGPEDRFITQMILTGIGHLKKLRAIPQNMERPIAALTKQALSYLDQQLINDYNVASKTRNTAKAHSSNSSQLPYLYVRSFFTEAELPQSLKAAYQYFLQQAQQSWQAESTLHQAMLAIMLHRNGTKEKAIAIMHSLEQARTSSKQKGSGEEWPQNAVAEKTVLAEAFHEINSNSEKVSLLQKDVLDLKQANSWQTPYTSALACYALLLQPTAAENKEPVLQVTLGTVHISNSQTEARAGYFKQTFLPPLLQPEVGNIQVQAPQIEKPSASKNVQAALYWQYFNEAKPVQKQTKPLYLRKQLFTVHAGKAAEIVGTEVRNLHKGDTLKVRLTFSSDRKLEYIVLKDAYAAAIEPLPVTDSYQVKENYTYYQRNNLGSMDYFVPALPKGTSVFEYLGTLKHAGIFTSNKPEIEPLYDSEIETQSEPLQIQVE